MLRSASIVTLAVLATLTLPGCDGDAKKDAAQDAGKTEKAPPPKPFEGELTLELVESFTRNTSATLYETSGAPRPWKDALPAVEAKLGKPTWKDGKQLAWGASDGTKCGYILLEDKDGKVKMGGGGTGTLGMLPKNMEAECRNAAGIPEPKPKPEKITAPPPPADGKTTVEAMLAGAKGNKPAWVGKSLEVTGTYFSTSTTKSDNGSATFVSVSVSKEKFKENVTCVLADGESLPDPLMQGTEVVVKGTMQLDTFGGGELQGCSLAVPE